MLVSCSKCGKLHKMGEKCPSYKRIYNKANEDKLRSKYAWTKKAKQIKQDSLNLCEICKTQGIYTYDGLEVHHITKLRDDPQGLLEDDNLITLCVYHHKQADDGQISQEYLKQLAAERTKSK